MKVKNLNLSLSPSAPRTVEVKEYRAPTDDSARLLLELEKEASGRIVDAYRLRSNDIDGVVVSRRPRTLGAFSTLMIAFRLNGKLHRIERDVPEMGFVLDRQRAFRELVNAVADAIAQSLIRQLARELVGK
jgi:hypothetical protein